LRRAAIVVALAACRGAPAADPSSLVVAQVNGPGIPNAPAIVDDTSARFEMAIDYMQLCVRIEKRVFCRHDGPADGRALAEGTPKFDDAVSIAVGRGFGCVVHETGGVSCWGANDVGQLGAGIRDEKSEAPVVVAGITNAKRVTLGRKHACALLEGGAVSCWGDNTYGATGGPVVYTESARELVTPDVVARVRAIAIAAGSTGSLAVTTDHRLTTWGFAIQDEMPTEIPRVASGITNADDVSADAEAACIVHTGGEVACVGNSYSLFPGYRGRAASPIAIPMHGHVRRVRVAERHACALLVDGRIECWGSNSEGALGRKTATESSDTHEPGAVDGVPHALDVFVGASMSCALTSRREMLCWGRWMVDGHERRAPSPVAVHIE
jgi:alpha-tubulin suppressor-like RCC1 family protein